MQKLHQLLGINLDARLEAPSAPDYISVRDRFNTTFDTNVASVHVLTEAFVDLLLKSACPRITFISSAVGSLALQATDIWEVNHAPPAGWPKPPGFTIPTYRTSKAAMNMMAMEWKRVLGNDGVKVDVINPGLLATDLGGMGADALRSIGAAEPIVGGKLVKSVIEGERDGDQGKMVQLDGIVPW